MKIIACVRNTYCRYIWCYRYLNISMACNWDLYYLIYFWWFLYIYNVIHITIDHDLWNKCVQWFLKYIAWVCKTYYSRIWHHCYLHLSMVAILRFLLFNLFQLFIVHLHCDVCYNWLLLLNWICAIILEIYFMSMRNKLLLHLISLLLAYIYGSYFEFFII